MLSLPFFALLCIQYVDAKFILLFNCLGCFSAAVKNALDLMHTACEIRNGTGFWEVCKDFSLAAACSTDFLIGYKLFIIIIIIIIVN